MPISLPDPQSLDRVADWVEVFLSVDENWISKSQLSSIIERESGVEPGDHFVDTVWREISRRNQLYGGAIFTVDDFTISLTEGFHPSPAYLACLLLSLYGVPSDGAIQAKLFERLAGVALGAYLSAQAINLGWPVAALIRGDNGDNEPLIKQRVRDVAARLYERFMESPPSRFKDRGIDTVAWHPFGDSRSGQVVVLLQCAAGHNWRGKLPVPLVAWQQYIHWASVPIAAFAVPCVVREDDWHETSTDKGLLLDRARLIRLIQVASTDNELVREVADWVQTELNERNPVG